MVLFQGRPEGTDEVGALYIADLSVGDVTKVIDLPDGQRGAWIVISDVSPDRTTVVYHLLRGKGEHEKWDLWTAPLAGGDPTLLRRNAGSPQYAPDGSIVFLDHAVPFRGDGIWIMDDDGGNARAIVEDRGAEFTSPRVSPDGTHVAYGHDGETEVVAIDGTGSGEATGEFSDEPAWFGNDTLIVG